MKNILLPRFGHALRVLLVALSMGFGGGASAGPIDARMLRQPDVSASEIAFVYAGDIWVVPKTGGQAQRLSSPRGEESFPRFSPDGSRIAFSANYDGNTDIYVMARDGGLPQRLTYHGSADRTLGWTPEGKSILFASGRTSEKDRFNQLFTIPVEGGLATKLPVPYGEFGAISPDSKTLAYVPISVDFATWKRYRGGMNPAIWLLDLKTFESRNLTGNESRNSQPMWHGTTLYFLSDRDKNARANLWAYDVEKKSTRQVTFFKDFDVHFPSIGPEDIVFENGSRLYLFNLASGAQTEVPIQVVTDQATLRPRLEDVSRSAGNPDISPAGKRLVLAARGELFTVPAEHGVVRNLTRSSGVAERYPAWSPDGLLVAYFSDRTGEYELTVRPADGTGEETVLTQLGPGYRYRPHWSPDSKRIAFIDQGMRMFIHDLASKKTTQIGSQRYLYHPALERFEFSWSRDSRWLAFALDQENLYTAIAIYDTRAGKLHLATTGFYDDASPAFDPEGKYLYYRSGREFSPVYSDLDNTWIYADTHKLVCVPLRKDLPSPLGPRNDDESPKGPAVPDKAKKAEVPGTKGEPANSKPGPAQTGPEGKPPVRSAGKTAVPAVESVKIDFDGFEKRGVILPPRAGRYTDLVAYAGKLLYRRLASSSDEDSTKSLLALFDLEKREEKTVLEDVDDVIPASKGEKILVRRKGEYAILEPKEAQKFEKKVMVGALETQVDPRAEWEQLFADAWRLQRDFFYDPALHGVDWAAMRERYGALLKSAVTRWDVNYVIGELIGELNSSHAYRSGGDTETGLSKGVGYLGVDFSVKDGAYQITRIITAAPWDMETRSPLREPGVSVKEGDFLLAVNGQPLDITQEPYAAFQGLADKPLFLTINSTPGFKGSRQVLVRALASEARLRHLAWIEKNRQTVLKQSGGKVGYVYVPDTGRGGQNELVRQFRAQFNKPGLIIDERFNSGGQIPDRFVEMLSRKRLNYWGVRDGKDWSWPQVAHNGPKAMLVNGWSGSGGDCFPYYFQQAKLGPVIGTRTWGGLIGMTGAPELVDGGRVTVPTFGIYNTKGKWIIENYGVDPDIEVVDDPAKMARGTDPQLDRAVQEVLKQIKQHPPTETRKPDYPVR